MEQNFFGSTGPRLPIRRSPIDIITYVASLVSNPRDVDPILDDLRVITVNLKPGELPDEHGVKQLAKVYFQLEDYLIHSEPLRAFNKDSLRQKVAKKFRIEADGIEAYWQQASAAVNESVAKAIPPEAIQRTKQLYGLGRKLIWGAVGLGFASLLLPVVPSPEYPFSNHLGMAFSVTAALLLFGAVWLFLKGLGGFTVRLKWVYRLLCAAMILLALAQSQQVIYTQLDLWSVPFIRQGGVALGFVPATLLFYIAMLLFARLLKLRVFASSVIALLVTGGVIAGLAAIVPLPSPLPPEILRVVLPPSLLLATVIAFSAMIALGIKRVVSPDYTRAMAWLFLGLASTAGTALIYALVQIFLPSENPILAYGFISLLFIATGVFMVRSALAFNLINEN